MAHWLTGTHRKRGIEQQHPLLSPVRQVAVGRNRNADVFMQFLKYIHERGWGRNAFLYREAEPHRLSWPVIRVLSEDHHFYIGDRRLFKGVKDQRAGGVDRFSLGFFG